MGIDTVALDGNGFDVHVSEGDHVTKDSKIATMDLDHVKSEGKDDSIIVLITNMHLIDKLTGEFKVGKGMKAGDRVEKAILV
jgi:phosphotransferase system IIA component